VASVTVQVKSSVKHAKATVGESLHVKCVMASVNFVQFVTGRAKQRFSVMNARTA